MIAIVFQSKQKINHCINISKCLFAVSYSFKCKIHATVAHWAKNVALLTVWQKPNRKEEKTSANVWHTSFKNTINDKYYCRFQALVTVAVNQMEYNQLVLQPYTRTHNTNTSHLVNISREQSIHRALTFCEVFYFYLFTIHPSPSVRCNQDLWWEAKFRH